LFHFRYRLWSITGSGYSPLSAAGGSWRPFSLSFWVELTFLFDPAPRLSYRRLLPTADPKEKNYRGTFFNFNEREIVRPSVPRAYRPQRLAYAERLQVQQIVRELLQAGIVRESHSEYASPIVLVKKKNGESRMCVDTMT
jgi:hypothetical protein